MFNNCLFFPHIILKPHNKCVSVSHVQMFKWE